MYKVFFKDRTVFLGNNPGEFLREKAGMYYRYDGVKDLEIMVDAFYNLSGVNRFYLYSEEPELTWKDFSSYFRIINAGGGLVRNSNDEILFIFRNDKWDLPKGKVDGQEEIKETALREVSEECGIFELQAGDKIMDTYHCYYIDKEPILKRTTWFEMIFSGNNEPKPQTEENITEIKWAKPGELDFVYKNTFPSILEVLMNSGIDY